MVRKADPSVGVKCLRLDLELRLRRVHPPQVDRLAVHHDPVRQTHRDHPVPCPARLAHDQPPAGGRPSVTSRPIENWEAFLVDGRVIGNPSARVKLVEFGDFQCPACAYMHATLRQLLDEYPDHVAVVYRHYPLSIHPYAVAAALASECAAAQGRFESYTDALFADQQWIGLTGWERFARTAGVPDSAEFGRCMSERDFIDRVERDIAMARELDLVAVPSVLLDGELLSGVAGADLKARIQSAIERQDLVR